jgi:hypothetical protein
MIAVTLIGRLGNQLFQYAFALSEQKRLGVYAVIDDRATPDLASALFTIKGIFRNRLVNKAVFRLKKFPMVYQDGAEDIAAFFRDQAKNSAYYYAYFQSEGYFLAIKDEIRKKIQVRRNFREDFQKKYGMLYKKNKVLAIHCRFGDYKDYHRQELGGANFVLPESYYMNALAQIPDLEQYLVIVVTDDIEAGNSRITGLKNKLVISDTEIMDFQLLQQADKVIIANSTFSWWAAYLNVKNAQVFAPEYWLGFKVNREFPNGVIPKQYTKVNVLPPN